MICFIGIKQLVCKKLILIILLIIKNYYYFAALPLSSHFNISNN